MLAVAPLAYHDDWRNNFRQQSDVLFAFFCVVSAFCLPSGLACKYVHAVAQPSLVAEAVAGQESAQSVGAAPETTAKHTHKNL